MPRNGLRKRWQSMPSEKRRQPFQCEDANGNILAFGVLYADSNVQIHWRISIGWTAEQFHSIANMFGLEVGVVCVRLVDELPSPPEVDYFPIYTWQRCHEEEQHE